MRITVLEPLGVELTRLRPAELGDAEIGVLAGLLAEHGFAVLPGQDLDDRGFTRFLGRFGELVFTAGETPVPGHPDLNLVTNAGRSEPPRSVFHVDTSYVREPPAYTALRAVTVPERGGQTLFTDQYRAFDTLPGELRARLAGRTVTHRVTGVDPGGAQESEAEHPLFRRHPITGRTSLYLSSPQRCPAISGLDDEEAAEVIRFLYAHSTAEAGTYRHTWSPGDLVMWDNGCVLHRADHSDVVGTRTLHRGMVAAYRGTP
ncbi:TauD/TfdA family dioxygenase [Amycolatopsis sp. PS_44_ISF1]|uniref:TauD/TfdA dioxygenase family protein n=1 Tax=Amycolatopsis sp. PS_44_ISF1 TaxID=2974917 RepID=UPI0028DF85AA|nr:TauD/TfdA family dioxygenase [Amycolatopsis sp. PS_44_ISF1]MDT8914746.1 TauD/TfdA family dioxygenase [Amycolatopsis sp. PS_44_ISF1]